MDVWTSEDLGGLNEALPPGSALFVFSTIQAALQPENSAIISRGVDLAIVDECHYLEENQFGRLVRRLRDCGTRVLGLTATPGRTDLSELDLLRDLFASRLISPKELGRDPVSVLQRRGVYSEMCYERITPTFELDTERVARIRGVGESRQRLFAYSPGRLDRVVEVVLACEQSDRILIFCYSIAHCHVVAAALHEKGVSVGILGSEFGDGHNRAMLSGFGRGHVRVLVNAKYAAVGADLPCANVAILTVPVGSPIFFEQVVGRVARGPAVGGTENARLYDFDNNWLSHGGVKAYARFLDRWT